ncbi:MAG: DNA integrity scanning protein DisA nucleotide-binding domain protein [Candidatus Pacearchaeota archaeon]
MPKENIKKIEEILLKISIEIAKSGEGALFVIGNKVEYSNLIKHKFGKLNVFQKGAEKILKGLAVIDGAVIINTKGELIAYGVMIKKARPFVGYGTRHAAGISASRKGNISILASEEERKVKIFKNGKYIMQIDALEKNVEKRISIISKVLESAGAGVIGTIGTVALIPTLGITLIPGIIIFGGSYYAIKSFIDRQSTKK